MASKHIDKIIWLIERLEIFRGNLISFQSTEKGMGQSIMTYQNKICRVWISCENNYQTPFYFLIKKPTRPKLDSKSSLSFLDI